jgi:hypothetical protein
MRNLVNRYRASRASSDVGARFRNQLVQRNLAVRSILGGRLPNFVPLLGSVSSGDEGLAEMILRVGPGELLGRAILERPVRPTLVILTPPGLDSVVSLPQ